MGISGAQQWAMHTTADGLAGNSIWFIREDEKGYLWFITAFDGASRYDGVRFQTLNMAHGLPSNNIYFILADRSGNFWFGTDRGLSRYDGRAFQNWDATDGLAGNYVTFILEDQHGHLWCATDGGVGKYDGKAFQHVDLGEGTADHTVTYILEDREGNLWFGTASGVIAYDGEDFQSVSGPDSPFFVQVIFEDSKGDLWFGTESGLYRRAMNGAGVEGPLGEASISAILEDRAGDLWLATRNQGVLKCDLRGRRCVTQEGLGEETILAMLEDYRGNLWFGTTRGVSKYNGKDIQHVSEVDGNRLNFVRAIWEDRDDNLWFGTENGAFKYTMETLRHFAVGDGLADNAIKVMLEDKAGNLWFGTEKGVSKYDGESFQNLNLQKDGAIDNHILSMCLDSEENLWIGTISGMYKNFKALEGEAFRIDSAVRAVLEDRAGNLWFAMAEGISRYDGAALHRFPVESGAEMLVDSKGNVWVGSWDAGLHRYAGEDSLVRYTMEEGLASNHITWIMETHDGDLWFGLKGGIPPPGDEKKPRGGIGRYRGSYFEYFGPDDGLLSNLVIAAEEDGEGNLWFGTDKGVMRYHPRSGDGTSGFTPLTKAHGLISNYVTAVFVDRAGHCWFGTDKGVSKYDGENFQNIFLKESMTFGFIETIFEDRQGNMWFITTNEGVFRYIPPSEDVGPRIHLTQVEADRIYREHFKEIRIPTTTQRITFEFKAISFKTAPGKMRFTYKLEGHDKNWHPSTHEIRAHSEKLDPGSYQFKVRAIDEDLHYSDQPATAEVILFEPFYLTSHFVVLMIFLGVGSIGGAGYLAVQLNRQRRLAAQFREGLRRQKEAEQIQLAKMESLRQFVAGVAHEVNNPIGAISGGNDVSARAIEKLKNILSEKYPQEIEDTQLKRVFDVLGNTHRTNKVASERIANIVTNLRSFVRLDEAEWDLTDIREGLDAAIALLEPELESGVVIEKEYSDIPRVFCSLSNLNQVFMAMLRNAAEAIAEKGQIRVRTSVEKTEVNIEISDTGRGIPPENRNRIFDPGFTTKGVKVGVGLGLAICHQIVVEEHKGRIEVESEIGQGTTFSISLPPHPDKADAS